MLQKILTFSQGFCQTYLFWMIDIKCLKVKLICEIREKVMSESCICIGSVQLNIELWWVSMSKFRHRPRIRIFFRKQIFLTFIVWMGKTQLLKTMSHVLNFPTYTNNDILLQNGWLKYDHYSAFYAAAVIS